MFEPEKLESADVQLMASVEYIAVPFAPPIKNVAEPKSISLRVREPAGCVL
jgi:hypothetical protein